VERIGDDLGDPHEPRLNVADEKELQHAEQQATEPDHQPDLAYVLDEFGIGGPRGRSVRREHPERGRIDQQDSR